MKKLALSIALIFTAIVGTNVASAQTELQLEKGAKIKFNKEVHDYGDIKYDGDPYCEFIFTNEGNDTLKILNAKGSCGCTVPEWPKDPILPGKSGVIKVKYDTKRPGEINKSVTITSNAVNEPTKVIRIKGMVGPAPASGVPVENSGAPTNH